MLVGPLNSYPCLQCEIAMTTPDVGVAALDIELIPFLTSVTGTPDDDERCLWSLLWRWGERRHSDECLEEPRSLE